MIHPAVKESLDRVNERINKLMNAPKPTHAPEYYHQKIGKILWDSCGMLREKEALIEAKAEIQKLEKDFWQKISVSGSSEDMNQTLKGLEELQTLLSLVCLCVRMQLIAMNPVERMPEQSTLMIKVM